MPVHHPARASMRALAALLVATAPLSACGLADTGSSAASVAKLKAQEAEQARAARAQVESQFEAARQQAEQRQKEIEAATR